MAGAVATAALTGGAVSTVVYAVFNRDNFSWEGAGEAFVGGAVDGYMWGGIGSAIAGVKSYVSVGKASGNVYGEILKREGGSNSRAYMTGKDGEFELANMFGGNSQAYFKTSNGGRYVDQLADGIAHESKVGYTSLSKRIKNRY